MKDFDLSDTIILIGICLFYTGVYFLIGVFGIAIFLGLMLILLGVNLSRGKNANTEE